MRRRRLSDQRGVALVLALMLSFAIMVLVTGVLYVVTQSTSLSAAGKGYATAEEAADGAINVMKDAVNMTLLGGGVADVVPSGACQEGIALSAAINSPQSPCTKTLNLASTALEGNFTATVSVELLFGRAMAGGRLEFPPSGGRIGGMALFYRITAEVVGPNNTRAENSALYRFAN